MKPARRRHGAGRPARRPRARTRAPRARSPARTRSGCLGRARRSERICCGAPRDQSSGTRAPTSCGWGDRRGSICPRRAVSTPRSIAYTGADSNPPTRQPCRQSDAVEKERHDVDVLIELMLATLTDRRGFDEEWILERKFDGERCVARKKGDAVRLESRTGKDLTGAYPDVRAGLAAPRPAEFLADGEVVVFDGEQTSFSRLQQRLGVRAPSEALVESFPAVYCVFDLLKLGSDDLAARPLVERRALLERSIKPTKGVQVSEAWRGDSE